jgi:hypothetical protein
MPTSETPAGRPVIRLLDFTALGALALNVTRLPRLSVAYRVRWSAACAAAGAPNASTSADATVHLSRDFFPIISSPFG